MRLTFQGVSGSDEENEEPASTKDNVSPSHKTEETTF